jgi:hypothetical protein
VLPDRPLRILQSPVPLLKNGEWLQLADFSSNPFRSTPSRSWRVTNVDGPEILSGEWWFRQFQRSYFRLATDTGEHLWVFQTPQSGTLYLHGYFD